MHKKRADNRPVNLNLFTIRFPITAISSILHRVSGFVLFLFIPLVLWGWQLSLESSASFSNVQSYLSSWYIKILLWGFLSALLYHILAGVRHLLMDAHIGDSKKGGKVGATNVIALTIILSFLLGVYLW